RRDEAGQPVVRGVVRSGQHRFPAAAARPQSREDRGRVAGYGQQGFSGKPGRRGAGLDDDPDSWHGDPSFRASCRGRRQRLRPVYDVPGGSGTAPPQPEPGPDEARRGAPGALRPPPDVVEVESWEKGTPSRPRAFWGRLSREVSAVQGQPGAVGWTGFSGAAVAAVLLVLGASSPALANRPSFAGSGAPSPGAAVRFSGPSVSRVLYYALTADAPVRWFAVEGDRPRELRVQLPSAGTYYGAVFDVRGQEGKLWVALGERAVFTWRDLPRLFQWIRKARAFHELSGWPRWMGVAGGGILALAVTAAVLVRWLAG